MVLELAKPVAFLLSIVSLYATFHAAFLVPATSFGERLQHALARLALAAAFSLIGGMLFREPADETALRDTLPMRVFCWASLGMTALFAISWYVESYCILYRDVRF